MYEVKKNLFRPSISFSFHVVISRRRWVYLKCTSGAENVMTGFLLQGIKCDLITGEQRLYATSEFEPADHVACTVEMYNLSKECKRTVLYFFNLHLHCKYFHIKKGSKLDVLHREKGTTNTIILHISRKI